MSTLSAGSADRGLWRRLGEAALKILGLFVILEPVWMLLPFAGFLYGSVLQIETLGRHPATAWLVHFVFPVLTLGWTGPVMVAAGLVLFLAGAGQIYWAKIRRSGIVTGGLYRFVRHPQYVALTLVGVGILLTWGRAITFVAFFAMMFLYYYLAKREERTCLRLFGEAYERYREKTSFILPGDRLLRQLGARLPQVHVPAPVRVTAALLGTMAVCFGLLGLIATVKEAARTVPYLIATVPLGTPTELAPAQAIQSDTVAGIPFVQAGRVAVVRGPYRNAWATGFAERVLQRLPQSKALEGFLGFLDEPGGDVAIVFCTPFERPDQPGTPGMHAGEGPGGRGPPPDPSGPDRVRLVILRCTLAPGEDFGAAMSDKSKRRIRGGCIAPVDLVAPQGEDIVEGKMTVPGPGFPGEERWDFLMHQMAAQPSAARRGQPAAVPGQAASAQLVLVQAPVLRTRLDPAFAEEILQRLVESPRLRDRLRASGAGGDIVAVAFPTPGPNWYHEFHGRPQLNVFVMLVRPPAGVAPDEWLRGGDRQVLSAFVAPVDFKIEPPLDSVGEIAIVGPWRDLEERWRFFLSGVGGRGI
jgi:protein-S-isoprenylcysteine O-methyltransferase Ste14